MVVAQFDTLLKFFTSGSTVMKTLSLPSDVETELKDSVPWPTATATTAERCEALNAIAGRDFHLEIEPMRGGIEIAAGSAKLSRFMALAGGRVD